MKIVIDIDKKTIEVPKKLKKAYESQLEIEEMTGKRSNSILDMLNLADYQIITKIVVSNENRKVDKTNAKTIEDYMNKVKTTDENLYNEYIALKNKVVGKSKNGKDLKTSFLDVKKWFYNNFPEEKPNKK